MNAVEQAGGDPKGALARRTLTAPGPSAARAEPTDLANAADLRSDMRLALLIRTAKLTCRFGEFLCIIRDVSQGGVKLRLFHALPEGVPLHLELANGDSFAIEHVWQKDDEAGFRFRESIDIKKFIAESGRHPKRPLRLQLTCPATVHFDGKVYDATIRDVSRQGARIETLAPLALEQKVVLSSGQLPELEGTVRWRRNPDFGLALQHIFSFRELATTVARMQLAQRGLTMRGVVSGEDVRTA